MELKYYLRGLGLGIAITAIVMGIVSSKNKTMTNEEIIARAKQLGMTENTVLDEINHKDDEQNSDKTDDPSKTDSDKTSDASKADSDETSDASNVDKDAAQTDNAKSDSTNLPSNIDNSNTSQKSDNIDNVANSQSGTRKTDSSVDAEAGDSESKAKSPDTETKTSTPDADTKTDSTDTNIQNDSTETKPSGTDTASTDKPMVITVGSGDGSYSVSKKLADVGAIESAGDFDTYLCNNGYDKKIRTGTYTIPANASEEQMARIITGAE